MHMASRTGLYDLQPPQLRSAVPYQHARRAFRYVGVLRTACYLLPLPGRLPWGEACVWRLQPSPILSLCLTGVRKVCRACAISDIPPGYLSTLSVNDSATCISSWSFHAFL